MWHAHAMMFTRAIPPRRVLAVAVVLSTLVMFSPACTESGDEASSGDDGDRSGTDSTSIEVGPQGYGAVITRTADGVPHIRAADMPNAAFGQGWASAEDHPCDLVDQVIKVSSERAATFGPGENEENLNSDFGWAALGISDVASEDWESVEGDERDLVVGFTDGWNASFEAQGADGIEDWCTGADWMRTLTPAEVYLYARSVTLLASGARVVDFAATAQPPGANGAGDDPSSVDETASAVEHNLSPATADPIASNAWAIGKERSADGGGMLVGNPHFPWQGELRFSEVQLTTDDGVDIYGAMLLGLPGVAIGFTDGVAWSHTVSAGNRFTAYEMTLDPQDPTSYMMDGRSTPMTSKDITIEVLGDGGGTTEETRTYWSTEFGPVLDFPGVGWTDTTTISYRDANLENDRLLGQYLQMARAQSLEELQEAHRENQGIPLFNTIAVGADGTAWYADTSATPNLSAEAQQAYSERLEAGGLTAIAKEAGAVLLEGDTSRDRWVDDPDAPWPGVLPYDDLPSIERDDYVLNANDSYWVANAEVRTDGDFSILQGETGTERSVRTLENLAIMSNTSAEGPSGDDGLFDLEELTAAALLDEAYTERQWRDGVVERCRAATAPVAHREILDGQGAVYVTAGSVDVSGACDVLEAWDGRYDVASEGAVLWREFTEAVDYDELWEHAFDEANPAATPAGLGPAPDGGEDPVLAGLADAVALLTKAGMALNVPLGEVQFDGRLPDERLPVPGGLGSEGVTNVVGGSSRSSTEQQQPEPPEPLIGDSTLTSEGYPITYGTSFLLAVAYGPDGPEARTILTYGQVGDPALPGFTSGVEAFADKQWKLIETDQQALAEDPDTTVTAVSA